MQMVEAAAREPVGSDSAASTVAAAARAPVGAGPAASVAAAAAAAAPEPVLAARTRLVAAHLPVDPAAAASLPPRFALWEEEVGEEKKTVELCVRCAVVLSSVGQWAREPLCAGLVVVLGRVGVEV